MNFSEAKIIAQQHARTIQHAGPGILFDVKDPKYPKEFHGYFYFDLLVKNSLNSNKAVSIGAPAGIIVSKKDMCAQTISFDHLSELEKNEAELEMLYNLLAGNNPLTDQLSFFKNKFKMESEQFLHLHREILKKEKRFVLNIIQDLLDKQKNKQYVN